MKELRVRDVMTPEVTTLKRNDKLTLADDIMHLGRIRHLPVLDDDHQLVGIVSQRDLFRGALATALGYGQSAQRKLLDSLLVKEVMSTDVITIGPDTLLAEAARVLVERKICIGPGRDQVRAHHLLDGERVQELSLSRLAIAERRGQCITKEVTLAHDPDQLLPVVVEHRQMADPSKVHNVVGERELVVSL